MPQIPNAREKRLIIGRFAIEAGVYAIFVALYFFAVLRFLGGWLPELFRSHRAVYAAAALLLMVGQGILLETLTTRLLRWVGQRTR